MPLAVRQLATPLLKPGERVIYSLTATLQATQKTVHRLVILDPQTHTVRKTSITPAGTQADFETLRTNEEAAVKATYGNLSPLVYTKASAATAAVIDVRIIHDAPAPSSTTPSKADLIALHKPNGDALVADLIAQGATIRWRGDTIPIIEASISPSLVLSWLKTHNLVRHVDVSLVKEPQTHGAAQSTTDLELSPVFYAWGFYGGSPLAVRVGILGETRGNNCTPRLDHPFLTFSAEVRRGPGRSCTTHADCQPACSAGGAPGFCWNNLCTAQHSTIIAGMIGHNFWGFPRGAPLVQLYDANISGRSHADDLGWHYDNWVDVVTESFGPADPFAQDYYSNWGLTITEHAANEGANDFSSCQAANTICVGGYQTLTTLYADTSSRNYDSCPYTGGCDREVPHVVFHAQGVVSTSNNPSDTSGLTPPSNGTSFAAPAAAGLAALMGNRWPNTFRGHPHLVPAAMMASAIGPTRDVHQPTLPTGDCPLTQKLVSDHRCPDERDGAGAPNASRVEVMVNLGRLQSSTLHRVLDFDANNVRVLALPYLNSGQRIRAVFSWSACPTYLSPWPAARGNCAHADIDLRLRDPWGNIVASSISYNDSVEIFEVVATASGFYTLEIQRYAWGSCSYLPQDYVYTGFAYDVL